MKNEKVAKVRSNPRCIFLVTGCLLILANSSIFAQTKIPEVISVDCRVRDYGAKGDGVTLDTAAINAAVQDCHSRGGGTVVVEAGTYLTGSVHLLDNITLKLEPGATVLGSENLADYTNLSRPSEGRDTALIVAENVHNVAIVGVGTIDGNGPTFTNNGVPHFVPYFEGARTRQGMRW